MQQNELLIHTRVASDRPVMGPSVCKISAVERYVVKFESELNVFMMRKLTVSKPEMRPQL